MESDGVRKFKGGSLGERKHEEKRRVTINKRTGGGTNWEKKKEKE